MASGVHITVFNTGWVAADNRVVVSGGVKKRLDMPALCALIRHPEKGNILYDTGYSTRFYTVTAKWPYRILRHLTPARISMNDQVEVQLERMGLAPRDIGHIVLGHGHVDHVPGLACFPGARVIVEKREWAAMNRHRLAAFVHGYATDLYRDAGKKRQLIDMEKEGTPLGPFPRTVDLFGDGTLVLVDLSGHTAGQMGLIVKQGEGPRLFFIGDAGWVSDNVTLNRTPSQVIRLFVDSYRDFRSSLFTVHKFHRENPEVLIVPSHCPYAWKTLQTMGLGFDNHE
jgi:glyoxylase-like metal-dependent hydrolase (beta-lactamase superfamily II)